MVVHLYMDLDTKWHVLHYFSHDGLRDHGSWITCLKIFNATCRTRFCGFFFLKRRMEGGMEGMNKYWYEEFHEI